MNILKKNIFTKNMNKIIFVIPCFNEEKNILKVIKTFQKYGKTIVVDDGSKDSSYEIAKKNSDFVIKKPTNTGYNSTLLVGLNYAFKKLQNYKILITVDADNQHKAQYVKHFVKKLKKFDIVVGKRNFFNRKVEKKISDMCYKKFNIKDPLSGMKGYKIKTVSKYIYKLKKNINYQGMFFFHWLGYLSISNINITVRRSGKISSTGSGKKINTEFLTSYLKCSKLVIN